MTNILSTENNVIHRPRLCRSDQQPNLLEYIDTTLNESFSLNIPLTKTIANEYDQYGNNILDRYLIYLLCQKISPNRTDHLSDDFYQLLHQLIIFNGKISKAIFEYSTIIDNQMIFNTYTNFIWNEFDVNILLELGCFLLKYRLRDLFNNRQQKMTGYFFEIITIYYLSSNHADYFHNSRCVGMIFPSPSIDFFPAQSSKFDEQVTFEKFLQILHDNGEISFDIRQIKFLLQNDAHQFLNKKLENKKIGLMKFFSQQKNSCQSLKSICRLVIKMHIKQFPNDIKKLTLFPAINDRLQFFLIYQNQFAFESHV